MIRLSLNGKSKVWRTPLGVLLAGFCMWWSQGAVLGAEFANPPGQNVERQEELLKEKVTELARSMVGENLINVVAHVGYAKTGKKDPDSTGQVKLPGFNSFIDTSGSGREDIVPEYLRLRQVFVVVSDEIKDEVKAIQKDLITQIEFDKRKGDWLQVVPLSASGDMGMDKRTGGDKAEEMEESQSSSDDRIVLPRNEPKSTLYLLKARRAYFKGNYDSALQQILKAIAIEPKNAQAYAMLGSLYYTINWKNLAVKYWQKSLQLDPDNAEIEQLVEELQESKL